MSQEPPIADCHLLDQPDLDGAVRGQPELVGHEPGVHVQGLHLQLPGLGGEGEGEHREQDLFAGAFLLQICKLPQLLQQVTGDQ